MSDLSLENQNTAERQTELIATNADLGPDELKRFPNAVILQVKPGANTRGSFDGINGVAGGTGRGVVGEGAGAGVGGFSRAGDGVVGISEAVGKSGVFGFNSRVDSAAFGVFGRCHSPAGAGVSGQNDNGDGVVGQSAKDGKSGVFGFNTNPSGEAFGVSGSTGAAAGAGIFGFSGAGTGVRGTSGANDGVAGFSAMNNKSGVFGVNTSTSGRAFGVVGRCDSPSGEGVSGGSLFGDGVVGRADRAGSGVVGQSATGNGVTALSSGIDPTLFVLNLGGTPTAAWLGGQVVVFGPLIVTGAKSAAVPHQDGSHRLLYSIESPESWFEDFGEASLVDGKAVVQLDPDFGSVVQSERYHVFLTPYGDSNGLYASNRYSTHFEVQEQKGGKSNVPFSYRIVAKRKDIVGERLAPVTLPERLEAPKAAPVSDPHTP